MPINRSSLKFNDKIWICNQPYHKKILTVAAIGIGVQTGARNDEMRNLKTVSRSPSWTNAAYRYSSEDPNAKASAF